MPGTEPIGGPLLPEASASPGAPPLCGRSDLAPSTGNDDTVDESTEHLSESLEPTNLIVVADVDMLGNQMWVQVQNFFGQPIYQAFADNGAFANNAIDNLIGSSDLISVRSRGTYSRPFERVEALRAEVAP